MASLDEQRKRAELARLAQSGSESSFQQEMMNDPVLAQRLAPSENRRAFDTQMRNVSDYQAQGLAAAQDASSLLQQEIPQDPIRDNFLTKRGDNQALNLLRGILSQRLISRGLLEDPTDIATRNLRAVQQRNEQIEGLQNQSDFYTNMADRLRADAVDRALTQGVPGVSPVQGLPTTARLEGLNRAAGTFATPGEQTERASAVFDLGRDIAGDARFQQQRALLPGLVAGGVISESQFRVFNNQDPEELNESLGKLTVDAPDGLKTLPGDKVNFLTREVIPDSRYSNEERNEYINFGKFLTQGQRDENKNYSGKHGEYVTVGAATDANNLGNLRTALDYLQEADESGTLLFTGALAGQVPDFVRAFYDEGRDSLDTRAAIRSVVQKTFREILGGQFAFLEGERLIQNAYDENLPPAYNLIRIRKLFAQAQDIADRKAKRANHWQTHGTLYGAGEKNLEFDLKDSITPLTDEYIAEQGLYSLFSADEHREMFDALSQPNASADAKAELEKLKAYLAENR